VDGVSEPLQDVLTPFIRVLIILALLPLYISRVVAHWHLEFLNVDLGLLQGMLNGLKLLRGRIQVSSRQSNHPQTRQGFSGILELCLLEHRVLAEPATLGEGVKLVIFPILFNKKFEISA
jgi:hypothetical protein